MYAQCQEQQDSGVDDLDGEVGSAGKMFGRDGRRSDEVIFVADIRRQRRAREGLTCEYGADTYSV